MIISDTGTLSLGHGVKLCVYGRSGIGKTRLLATAPQPLVLSAENGLLSLSNEKLPAVRITSQADLLEAHAYLLATRDGWKYRTICLDSLTDFADMLLEEEKKSCKDPRKAYGNMQDKLFAMIRAFRDLPNRHVVFIAQEAQIQDETGTVLRGPLLPGKTAQAKAPYFWDEVLQLAIGGTKPNEFAYLRCKADFANDAKDRSGRLNEMEPPNLKTIFDKIEARTASA